MDFDEDFKAASNELFDLVEGLDLGTYLSVCLSDRQCELVMGTPAQIRRVTEVFKAGLDALGQ